ncbi:hypothetical protein K461DRAFT_292839 [Myriangium duriaei CBS 260.36]|uniref:HIT-type domain-containing protein n=1 Tax=Myriangium duriaei CBS 260.36 TaxID=1168546 RepID=A0A9P4MGZ2_9PEZI|nr:hypothetical protein K461DRAFT_292839 [Myriangium duriaei CBS 260.36]
MAADCAICFSAASKYKCPTCEIRYCSIACYKTHKPIHADNAEKPITATPLTAISTDSAPIQAPSTSQPPLRHPLTHKPDFSGFESDEILLDLLRKDPKLRIKLQSVYGLTLEPPPATSRGGFRGGRGGRGAWRGRGGGSGSSGGGSWTQAKGDAEALEKLAVLRGDEGEEGGVAEFIRLVGMRFGERQTSG